MKPVYTWLLFDADHTILDFDAAEAHALKAVCTELAGEFRSEWVEAYHRINKGLWALLEKGEDIKRRAAGKALCRFPG
jgi:FMN phosphatase YigB (HAD superfamily)